MPRSSNGQDAGPSSRRRWVQIPHEVLSVKASRRALALGQRAFEIRPGPNGHRLADSATEGLRMWSSRRSEEPKTLVRFQHPPFLKSEI